jgi:sec-independent protein translocase protein TatC
MSPPSPVKSADSSPDEKRMTIGEHLEELRRRVLWAVGYWAVCSFVAAWYGNPLMAMFLEPTMQALEATGQDARMAYFSPTESFGVNFKVILIVGAVFASPLVAWELWGFVAAGLYGREKRMVQWAAPISFLLFLGGAAFFHWGVLPAALEFLYSFGREYFPGSTTWRVESVINVQQYVTFYLWMSLTMGVIFQLPLVMFFLSLLGLARASSFAKYQRHFILGATVVAAVITPTGDALTLSLFMLPILALFYIGLIGVWLRERISST